MKYRKIKEILTRNIINEIESFHLDWEKMQEIRIRIGQPVKLRYGMKEITCKTIVGKKELKEIIEFVSNYSLYAYENELRQGFLTIEGGHRVGIAGQVLMEREHVKNMKNISSVNIRVSHEVKHCADKIMPYIVQNNRIYHNEISKIIEFI